MTETGKKKTQGKTLLENVIDGQNTLPCVKM